MCLLVAEFVEKVGEKFLRMPNRVSSPKTFNIFNKIREGSVDAIFHIYFLVKFLDKNFRRVEIIVIFVSGIGLCTVYRKFRAKFMLYSSLIKKSTKNFICP